MTKKGAGNDVLMEWEVKNPPSTPPAKYSFRLIRKAKDQKEVTILTIEGTEKGRSINTGIVPDGTTDFRVETTVGGKVISGTAQLGTEKGLTSTFFEPFDQAPASLSTNFDATPSPQTWVVKDGVISQVSETLGQLPRLSVKAAKTSDGEIRAKVRVDRWEFPVTSGATTTAPAVDLSGVGLATETIAGQNAAFALQFHQPVGSESVFVSLFDIVEDGRKDASGTAVKGPIPYQTTKLPTGTFLVPSATGPDAARPWIWMSLKRVGGNLIGKIWLDGDDEPADTATAKMLPATARAVVLVQPGLVRTLTSAQTLGPPALLGGAVINTAHFTKASFDEITFKGNAAAPVTTTEFPNELPGSLSVPEELTRSLPSRTAFATMPYVEVVTRLPNGHIPSPPDWSLEAEAELVVRTAKHDLQFGTVARRADMAAARKKAKTTNEQQKKANAGKNDGTNDENDGDAPPDYDYESPETQFVFYDFPKLAQFPLIRFGTCKDEILTEGVKIHEGMRVVMASDGRYEVVFTATSIGLPATVNLQLQVFGNNEIQSTLTLPPIELFNPTNVAEGMPTTWTVRVPGYSELFNTSHSGPKPHPSWSPDRRNQLTMREGNDPKRPLFKLRRIGSARIGATAIQLSRTPVGVDSTDATR